MTDARAANLLGALVTGLQDDLAAAAEAAAAHGAAFPAALVTLQWQPGLTIEALRQVLGLSHSGTVRLLDRLEAEGAVERRPGEDGRSVAVHLTPVGRRQVRAVLGARARRLGAALERLSAGERAQFTRLVEKLLGGLTAGRAHADRICRLCDEGACPDATCPVECAARTAD